MMIDQGDLEERLYWVIFSMVEASLQATPEENRFGPPCQGLVMRCVEIGGRGLAKEWAAELLQNPPVEFRLNGAGLKIWLSEDERVRHGVTATVGGDQFNMYPKTGAALRRILVERGF